MSSPSLEGLNLVYPPSDNSQAAFDFSNPISLPELDAQLDLWTNLAFQSDEPIIPRSLSPSGDDKQLKSIQAQHMQSQQDFNLSNYNFFNQFSIDPFLVPPAANHPLPPSAPSVSSQTDSIAELHLAKRPKTTKRQTSIDKSPSPEADTTSSADNTESPNNIAAVSAAEDKRRRNTAASARFRAKKKEREAALEKKSKELESKVSELERECESLRRENGWLKGLVVGVTGASAGATSSSANAVSQGTKRKRPQAVDEKPLVHAGPETDIKIQAP